MAKNEIARMLLDNYHNTGDMALEFSDKSPKQKDDMIRTAMFSVLGKEDFKDEVELAKAMRAHKVELFEIIEEVIENNLNNGTYENAFFDKFVETRNLALGDKQVFYIEGETELEVSRIAGEGVTVDRQRLDAGKDLTVDFDTFGIKVFDYLIRSLTGRITFSDLIVKLNEAVEKSIRTRAYASFQALVTSIPAPYKHTGAYDEVKIKEVVGHVHARVGSMPQLVGTAIALGALQGSTPLQSDSMKNERNQNGFIRVWQGFECIEIGQAHKEFTTEFMFDNKDIFVIAGDQKPVKVVLRPGMIDPNQSTLRTSDRTQEYQYEFDLGVATICAPVIGHIKLA